ncbi:uncharacterized protein LOC114828619 [Galendromus occidentalis]|uniref:Uncharacterized protein LOC114828619 n=1 Tax=Galendromus occidentalis TaxID=34638 RepID=A0AAJ7SI95_9ACAR|nr:uncharacterized protein LOC114828619 [Galendromus occidentalis]
MRFRLLWAFSTILLAVVDADNHSFLHRDVGTGGDDAFLLRTNLLRPNSRCGPLNEAQCVSNYRLSKARPVVENAFGLLVSTSRISQEAIPLAVETTDVARPDFRITSSK